MIFFMIFLHDLSDQDGIIYNGMKKADFLKFLITILVFTAAAGSCINPDYFTAYTDKNLAAHKLLSSWSTGLSTTYMNYEAVSSATAGTTGLPDQTALIYRLETLNLFPDGDFEATAAGSIPSGWSETGGTHEVRDSGHNLSGKALYFSEVANEYLTFSLNNLSDGAAANSSYVFRYNLEGAATGPYYFEIEDTSAGGTKSQYKPNIPVKNKGYEVPVDFNEVPLTSFLIHSSDSEVFRINFAEADKGQPQIGYIDDFRVVRSDQNHTLTTSLPYEDSGRVDGLTLISGTYRFSVYVKADPAVATTNNSFDSGAVTLKLEALDPDGSGGSIYYQSFSAEDYSSFADWTLLYVDAELQINIPEDTTDAVIRLAVSPCDCTGGAMTVDSGSILISNPGLEFSASGTF